MANPANNLPSLRQEAKDYYRRKENIVRKWLKQYGSLSHDNIYQQNRTCLSEVFNMLDVVMENCIDDFRHSHTMLAIDQNDRSTIYTFLGDDGQEITFISPKTFALRIRALRAIGYKISDELLYSTRILRNETTHGNQTVVLQRIELGYDETMKAMLSMADTLILLDMLDEEYRTPSYEMMRVQEGDELRNGTYRIGRQIGEGGMSRVFAATQSRTGLKLAAKEMKPGNYSDEMLRHEGDILMHLHHNRIPQVHDTFFENGTYYIIMDYVDGVTLDCYMKEHEIDEKKKKDFVSALLDVLSYLHSPAIGLVFSDLSPDNVLIDGNDDLHLIDFGTTVRLNAQQNLAAGTIGYAAPEVLAGGALDERTDIYSFGYLLRFLYSGMSPSEERERPTDELIDDQRIAEVINKCTDNNPEARYQSISELKEILFPEVLSEHYSASGKLYAILFVSAVLVFIFALMSRYSRKQSEEKINTLQQESQKAIEGLQKEISNYEGREYISAEDADIDMDRVITWTDSNLEKAVRDYTGIADGSITYEDLWSYDTFELRDSGIRDISDLSDLVNITTLDLSGNQVSDLSPLRKLTGIQYLYLSGNTVSDIDPLNELEYLKALEINDNLLESLEIKGNWRALETLNLSDNPMAELKIDTEMTALQELIVQNAHLSVFEPGGLLDDLRKLDLSGNEIRDFSFLKELPSVEELNISNNPTEDIVDIACLKRLKQLYANDCRIQSLDWLQELQQLETLSVNTNQIADLGPLSEMSTIKSFMIDDNPLAPNALQIISTLEGLTELSMRSCSLSSVEGLEKLKSLSLLDIYNNTISDLAPLTGLTNITYLNAANNCLTGDLEVLSGMRDLYHLEMQGNGITDISALKNKEKLVYLDLSNNKISDFAPIETLVITDKRIEGQSI